MTLTVTIDFLLSESILEWKKADLTCGFALHWFFIMCEGTVSVSKMLEENFCLAQQPQDSERSLCLFSEDICQILRQ